MFFLQRCVYLCDWVYVYIHMDIYITALMMMISWGTFFAEVLSSCFLKGNNTFDGKIIVT